VSDGFLRLTRLSGNAPVVRVIRYLRRSEAQGKRAVAFDFDGCQGIYPNAVAPVAAVVDLFRQRGLDVKFMNVPPALHRVSLDHPVEATKANLRQQPAHWNTVWRYSDGDQVFALAKSLIEDLIERIEFGPGVLEALSWCLYEILDNVLQHARIGTGYIMLQYMPGARRLAVCIADAGIGVHKSFIEGGHYQPILAKDALELAVAQWTSSTGEPRGNGLYGLAEVVGQNIGTLDLRSGRALLHRSRTQRYSIQLDPAEQLFIDADHYCTAVDFQLSVQNPVHISEVLGGAHFYNHEIEPLMDDEGMVVVPISEYASKVATRDGAIALKVRLLNYLAEGAPHVTLDFTGVGVISSSFADETIGRLVEHFGIAGFFERFSFRSVSDINQSLIDRAIQARGQSDEWGWFRRPSEGGGGSLP
jgi:hypothetical protein